MSEKKAEPGAGDIEIELDGKSYTMSPTLDACRAISRLHGGAAAAVQHISSLDFDTIVAVIGHGIGANPAQMEKLLPDLVFKTGTAALRPKCIEFVGIVNNGGRPLSDEDEEERETDEGPLGPGSLSGNSTEN